MLKTNILNEYLNVLKPVLFPSVCFIDASLVGRKCVSHYPHAHILYAPIVVKAENLV